MDVMNVAELPAKIKPTNFTLCIQCQEIKSNDKLSKARDVSSVLIEDLSMVIQTLFQCHRHLEDLPEVISFREEFNGTILVMQTPPTRVTLTERKKPGKPMLAAENVKGDRPSTDLDANIVTRSKSQTFTSQKCFFSALEMTQTNQTKLYMLAKVKTVANQSKKL
jgi:hypothetical protein